MHYHIIQFLQEELNHNFELKTENKSDRLAIEEKTTNKLISWLSRKNILNIKINDSGDLDQADILECLDSYKYKM